MLDPIRVGGLALGLLLVGALVVVIGLGRSEILSRSVKVDGTASLPMPELASSAAIPPLDAEVPGEVATATFALG
jgi:hypothetical protein